jgi:hypothetical protein
MKWKMGGAIVPTLGASRGKSYWRAGHRRVVTSVLATLTFSGFLAFSKQAQACDPLDHVREYHRDPDVADTTPPVLSAADISIYRADDPGNNSGDCSGLGGYKITVDASDDQTVQDDLGFSLKLVDGSFPFHIPEDTVIGNQDDGTLSDWFTDEGEAFDGTLEVRVVDQAGNRSEPKLVSAAGDEVGSDISNATGCSCSAAGELSTKYSRFLPLAVLMVLVRRRFPRAAARS